VFDSKVTLQSTRLDILPLPSACGIPHDFHGSFSNDHARPCWFARGRTQTRTADFLVTSNELTRASSHWLRFRFGSLSLALLSPDDSLLGLLRSHRLSILSSAACPSFTSTSFSRSTHLHLLLWIHRLFLFLRIYTSANAEFSAMWRFLHSKVIKRKSWSFGTFVSLSLPPSLSLSLAIYFSLSLS